jgi:hypothetical protein
MEGKQLQIPEFLRGRDAVVWSREYSWARKELCDCKMLQETLSRMGANRMIVGHTIQADGINGACEDQVLRCICLWSATRFRLFSSFFFKMPLGELRFV